MNLISLVSEAAARGASDLHLVPGEPPIFRKDGRLSREVEMPPVTQEAFRADVLTALPERARRGLEDGSLNSADTTLTASDEQASYKLFVYRIEEGFAANLRIIPGEIPSLEAIGGDALPELQKIAQRLRGLVLFAGPTGSGKLTTATSVLDHINQTRAERIYILEDVPGYAWKSRQSIVTVLRVGGGDTLGNALSYEQAAQMLMRGADPDIVFFTDLLTVDTLRQAMILAETGHLVLANTQAESAADLVEFLTQSLPEPHVAGRDLLARTLAAVFCQRLLPRIERVGRVCAYEFLLVTPTVHEVVRQGASARELQALIDAGEGGSRSQNVALDRLLAQGAITEETARQYRVG